MKIYVRKYRLEKGMSIRVLSVKTGIARSFIEDIEKGRANPTLKTMCKLAEILETNIHELFDC